MQSNTIPFPWQRQIPVKQIATAAQALIDLLDVLGGDPDLEANGDEADFSVAGWTAGRHGADAEDAEDDDPAEEDDPLELNGDEGDYGGEVDGI